MSRFHWFTHVTPLAHMSLSTSSSGFSQLMPGLACATQVPLPTAPVSPKHKSPGPHERASPSLGMVSHGSPAAAPATHVVTRSSSAISQRPDAHAALSPHSSPLDSWLLRQAKPAVPWFKQPTEAGPHWKSSVQAVVAARLLTQVPVLPTSQCRPAAHSFWP